MLKHLCTLISALLLGASLTASAQQTPTMPEALFHVEQNHFVLHGQPIQILSGELHYARIPREYWRARMRMAKAMGLNTIATYVFWNVHEPQPGIYDFSGNNDIATFIRTAQSEGLNVLLRAGPYACAEWEFGGFPAWLLKDPKMATALRSNDPAFMVPVERWMKRLAQEVGPLQEGNGGPIIATQIENEYGNFSNGHAYMQHMRAIFVDAGFNKSLLYTVDPSKALANGQIDGVLSGVNFGTGNAEHALDLLAKSRPGQPLFATEYWPGWFDLWGHPHETRPLAPQLKDLDTMLSRGASINIYMVHGGTTFGQMAGASQSTGSYRGNVTSYDYDAPIDEAGHPTAKFFAYRDLILKYTHDTPSAVPTTTKVITIPAFRLTKTRSLWEDLPAPAAAEHPLTMEQVDQAYGYILYRTQLPAAVTNSKLQLDHLQDYAIVYVNGKQAGVLDRHYKQDTLTVSTTGAAQLDILVENTGRLNSTRWMRDERKGIRGAMLNGTELTGWKIFSFPMSAAPTRFEAKASRSGPHFASGQFTLREIGDTYLDVRALGKGLVWINGHALGRVWNIGPQGTMYVPAPWLRMGRNEVVVFDLMAAVAAPVLQGLRDPILDAPTPTYANDPERAKKPDVAAEFGPKLAAPAVTTPAVTPPTATAPKE